MKPLFALIEIGDGDGFPLDWFEKFPLNIEYIDKKW